MARILYGVCGEGLGHAVRSKILIDHLKKNHDVVIAAGGKAYTFLSRDYPVTKIESLRFTYKKSHVALMHSILNMGYRMILKGVPSFLTVRKVIRDFKPDVVVTDADPFTLYAARFTKGLKRISVDNPQVLLHRKYEVNLREFIPWLILVCTIKIAMFGADKYIIYDFLDSQGGDRNVIFMKPLIQKRILQHKPRYGNHVFVYQTTDSNDELLRVLKNVDEKFIMYGFNKDGVDKNLIFKRFNEDEFYHDLVNAKAVITNGGFTLIGESLYLRKPIFSLPIKNQFEQILNGKFVEKLGAGVCHMKPDIEKLQDFFNNLSRYKEQLKSYNPGNQEEILKQLEIEILGQKG